MPKYKVDIRGVGEVQRTLGKRGALRLRDQIHRDIGEGTESAAERAWDNAPVDTGALRASIIASIRKEGRMNFTFGSNLPYAQWQEYNHATKMGYFRRAVWAEQPEIGDKIGMTVRRVLK